MVVAAPFSLLLALVLCSAYRGKEAPVRDNFGEARILLFFEKLLFALLKGRL